MDADGKVYIYFTLRNAAEMIGCGRDKESRFFKELDKEGGISFIGYQKQDQGRPTCIYVKNFILPSDTPSSQTMEEENNGGTLPLGRYKRLRERFLKEQHNAKYTSLLLAGRLNPYLREIDRQAQERVERIVKALMKQNDVDEAREARNQMGWVRHMNGIHDRSEEIVLHELIYAV